MDIAAARYPHSVCSALQMLKCILGNERATYISTPLTNGKRLVNWRLSLPVEIESDPVKYKDLFYKQVFIPNCEEGKRFAAQVRSENIGIVIDPSCFEIQEWSQSEYLDLWCHIIVDFAKEVRFNEGWEFSAGCTHEFEVAYRAGIPVKGREGNCISLDDAIFVISAAIPALCKAGVDSSFLERNLHKIKLLM